ncbi:site-specific integrase [Cardiobacteriaceae bacterium TAE3-ERU3]|nr:site-specific integrase [Cardiobacteriaceae bacterium TAE3-ERU3]
MASYTKVGKRWRCQVRRKGHKSRSKYFNTKREAEIWARSIEAQIEDGDEALMRELDKLPFYALIRRYMREVSPTKKSGGREKKFFERTMRDYPEFVSKTVTEVSRYDVARWRDDRLKTVTGSTVNREWAYLSAVMTYAMRYWALPIKVNPFTQLARPPKGKARNQRITDDDIDRIITAMGYARGQSPVLVKHYVAWAVLFAVETAMRASEICKLEWDDIRTTSNGRQMATLRDTKNGDDRQVPFSKAARELWALLPDGDRPVPITGSEIDANYRKYRPDDLSHIRFHDTRHEALSRLAKIIPNPMDLAKISGHRDVNILHNVYYAPDDEHLASLVD